ncbi:MAG: hypothetical protein Q4F95_14520 [Oscillospiraceae bacterium]|nr:hypothetical protein [Oscillospiraceae bacterium]
MDSYILFTPFSASYDTEDGYQYCIQKGSSEVEKTVAHFFKNIVTNKADEHHNKEMTDGIMYYICLEDCAILFKIIYTEGGFSLTGMYFDMKMILLSWHNIKDLMIYLTANDDISPERRVDCDDIPEHYDHYLSESFKVTCRLVERQSSLSLIPRSFITGRFPPEFYGVSEKDILFVQAQYGNAANEKNIPKPVRTCPECIPYDKDSESSQAQPYVVEYTDPPKKKLMASVRSICSPKHNKNLEFIKYMAVKNKNDSSDSKRIEELSDTFYDINNKQTAMFELEKIIDFTRK